MVLGGVVSFINKRKKNKGKKKRCFASSSKNTGRRYQRDWVGEVKGGGQEGEFQNVRSMLLILLPAHPPPNPS